MRYLAITLLTLCLLATKSNAQEASVEQSLWGIQVGVSPLVIYNETKLTRTIVLRTELAAGVGWGRGSYSFDMDRSEYFHCSSGWWAIIPSLNIEPRYFYNLDKRKRNGKRIDGNSGNFLSVLAGYRPGLGITSDNIDFLSGIYVVPMWGIKRNIGKHFNFEAGVGLGYSWVFKKYTFNEGPTLRVTDGEIARGLRLGFGYRF